MAKLLSLKLRDETFKEVEAILRHLNISRNSYINDAVALYNLTNKRKILKKQLEKESKLVRENSLKVLQEFEELEDGVQ